MKSITFPKNLIFSSILFLAILFALTSCFNSSIMHAPRVLFRTKRGKMSRSLRTFPLRGKSDRLLGFHLDLDNGAALIP